MTDKLPTIHKLYKNAYVNIETKIHKRKFIGSSVAARHTTVIDKQHGIVMDAGMVSHEMRDTNRVLLITHGHADHSLGIPEMYKDEGDEKMIIFCPDSICEDAFLRIKSFLQMQKGRRYSNDEIMQRLEMYAIRIKHKNQTEFEKSISKDKNIFYQDCKIADIVDYNQLVIIKDREKEFGVRPFPCYHTVDTCGYSIETIKTKLKSNLIIQKNKKYIVNFTKDQPRRLTKAEKKLLKKDSELIIETKPKYDFDDIIEFSKINMIDIDYKIIETKLETGHILYQREIQFNEELNMKLDSIDKFHHDFFSRYKINIYDKIIIPETLFFGDTSNIVFKNKLIKNLISKTKTVIIESTFLEKRKDISDKQLKIRENTNHMFLEDLVPIINKYKDVDFILMHFSARYNKTNIKKFIEKEYFDNVSILI
jgi:ribonuclease BN (tRNA processing enzyme)